MQGSKSTRAAIPRLLDTDVEACIENNRRSCFDEHFAGGCVLDLTHLFNADSVAGLVCDMGICNINTISLEQMFDSISGVLFDLTEIYLCVF